MAIEFGTPVGGKVKCTFVPADKTVGTFDIAPNPKWFVSIAGAGHGNFIEMMGNQKYISALRCFMDRGSIQGVSCK